jgi:hypothetical protein
VKTTVVHCKKKSYDIYIGRPSQFGNPYSHLSGTLAEFKVDTREEAIEKYREYILGRPDLLALLPTLKRKRLGCFCRPQRCHGDVLIELIDELYPDTND